MRELVVTLDYDGGVNPVVDVFIDHPELVSQSVDVSVSESGLTRVDRVSGPERGIEDLASVYLDPAVCTECTVPTGDCDATRRYEVVDDAGDGWTVYTYHESVSFCHSVPYHAATHLPPGVLFESRRRGSTHEWRVLMRSDDTVGDLYDALVADLPAGVTVSFRRLGTPERWGSRTGTVADLSPEQRAALETAVAMDYYDTPRGATLADVSTALGVPQSTLRYRLRRAEAWVTDALVADDPLDDPGEHPPAH
jgi:predicted DNA binding protein